MKPRPILILLLAFSVLALVPLWGSFGFLKAQTAAHGEGGGHAHGGGGDAETMQDEFAAKTKFWIASRERPDGCVAPVSPTQQAESESGGMDDMDMDDMDMEGMDKDMDMEGMDMDHGSVHPPVYLQALQFGYIPERLCLKAGVTYQFNVMSTDVTHGAAIKMKNGSRMMRLPGGSEVQKDVTFTKPGEYLVYCTTYCGVGHELMKGQITVEPGSAG